jgi:hypothetical protein
MRGGNQTEEDLPVNKVRCQEQQGKQAIHAAKISPSYSSSNIFCFCEDSL